MLKRDTLATFATLPVERQVNILTSQGLANTDAGEAVLGHLAIHHPESHRNLTVALAQAAQ